MIHVKSFAPSLGCLLPCQILNLCLSSINVAYQAPRPRRCEIRLTDSKSDAVWQLYCGFSLIAESQVLRARRRMTLRAGLVLRSGGITQDRMKEERMGERSSLRSIRGSYGLFWMFDVGQIRDSRFILYYPSLIRDWIRGRDCDAPSGYLRASPITHVAPSTVHIDSEACGVQLRKETLLCTMQSALTVQESKRLKKWLLDWTILYKVHRILGYSAARAFQKVLHVVTVVSAVPLGQITWQ